MRKEAVTGLMSPAKRQEDALPGQPPRIERLSHSQHERLAYIEFRLYFIGEIGRPDLTGRFGVAPAGATRDIALYRELAPQNIEFDGSGKIYRIGQTFAPIFDHSPQRVLSALSLGFGDGIGSEQKPLLPCEFPATLTYPRIDVLAAICRSIHGKSAIAIRYHSMMSGESERQIVPFALVDTGLRWHVRAFDRKTQEFRDFVLTRIEKPTILDGEILPEERPENDIQWTRIVELELIPHPRLDRPEIIRMDYGIQSESVRIRVRAAVAGYMLRRWSVDSSPDHVLTDEHYRLWLKDPLALYGVENAKIAPGYRAPKESKI